MLTPKQLSILSEHTESGGTLVGSHTEVFPSLISHSTWPWMVLIWSLHSAESGMMHTDSMDEVLPSQRTKVRMETGLPGMELYVAQYGAGVNLAMMSLSPISGSPWTTTSLRKKKHNVCPVPASPTYLFSIAAAAPPSPPRDNRFAVHTWWSTLFLLYHSRRTWIGSAPVLRAACVPVRKCPCPLLRRENAGPHTGAAYCQDCRA
jgi:hypothetical protein